MKNINKKYIFLIVGLLIANFFVFQNFVFAENLGICDQFHSVYDFYADNVKNNYLTLNWITPFYNKRLTNFDIRVSLNPIKEEDFFQAKEIKNNIVPLQGALQTLLVNLREINLQPEGKYYFAIKVYSRDCNIYSPLKSILVKVKYSDLNISDTK